MIGKKAGMTRIFDSSGMSVPVTAISITPNHVSQIKTLENDGYRAIQVSYGEKKETRVNKPITGHYKKVNLKPGEGLVEFRLENEVNQDFKVGDKIDSNMFKEGEHGDHMFVVVTGKVSILRGGNLIAEQDAGSCIGEMAILDHEPRSADAKTSADRATTSTSVASVPGAVVT